MAHLGSTGEPTGSAAVLYVSETLLAVDKPTGIIVHGDGTGAPTLTGLMAERIRGGSVPGVSPDQANELQALQRLDRDTSGIVLFSLCKRTQGAYDRLIAERAISKRYLAIACGKIPWDDRAFTWPISRDRHDARRMRVSKTGRWLTLLDVYLHTGRKHQIRVHLAHAGFPLLGDALYGTSDPRGLMLHAHELAFTDPVTGVPVRIVAPVPARMLALFPRM